MGLEFVLGIAALLLAYHLGMRYVITYRQTDRRLEKQILQTTSRGKMASSKQGPSPDNQRNGL